MPCPLSSLLLISLLLQLLLWLLWLISLLLMWLISQLHQLLLGLHLISQLLLDLLLSQPLSLIALPALISSLPRLQVPLVPPIISPAPVFTDAVGKATIVPIPATVRPPEEVAPGLLPLISWDQPPPVIRPRSITFSRRSSRRGAISRPRGAISRPRGAISCPGSGCLQ